MSLKGGPGTGFLSFFLRCFFFLPSVVSLFFIRFRSCRPLFFLCLLPFFFSFFFSRIALCSVHLLPFFDHHCSVHQLGNVNCVVLVVAVVTSTWQARCPAMGPNCAQWWR